MITVSIYNPQKYEFDEGFVISRVEKTIKENLDSSTTFGMTFLKDIEVSVAVVAHDQLVKFARKYFDDETEEELQAHPVLSFVSSEVEGNFVAVPDNTNHLGEIIVSWEKADKSTKEVADLAAHGILHLLGIHHD